MSERHRYLDQPDNEMRRRLLLGGAWSVGVLVGGALIGFAVAGSSRDKTDWNNGYWTGVKNAQEQAANSRAAADELMVVLNAERPGSVRTSVFNGEVWIPAYQTKIRYPVQLNPVFGLPGSWFGAQRTQTDGSIKVAAMPFIPDETLLHPYDKTQRSLPTQIDAELDEKGHRHAAAIVLSDEAEQVRITPGEIIGPPVSS